MYIMFHPSDHLLLHAMGEPVSHQIILYKKILVMLIYTNQIKNIIKKRLN